MLRTLRGKRLRPACVPTCTYHPLTSCLKRSPWSGPRVVRLYPPAPREAQCFRTWKLDETVSSSPGARRGARKMSLTMRGRVTPTSRKYDTVLSRHCRIRYLYLEAADKWRSDTQPRPTSTRACALCRGGHPHRGLSIGLLMRGCTLPANIELLRESQGNDFAFENIVAERAAVRSLQHRWR